MPTRFLKRIARAVLPKPLHFSVLCPSVINRLITKRTNLRVVTGPFEGMRYVAESAGSVWAPKILGIYEKELHEFVHQIIQSRPQYIIDIGAAEGYYAVGLARALPKCQIVAFEMDPTAREALKNLITLNSVEDRVTVLGNCDSTSLLQALSDHPGATIICDAEGSEAELLNPACIAPLRWCPILVELHKTRKPQIDTVVKSRFASTHVIKSVLQVNRSYKDLQLNRFTTFWIPRPYLENTVNEFRQPWEEQMEWLWMVPRVLANPA